MYRYETHLHTSPASACGHASATESVAFYKKIGYAGVFITNHFLDANVGCDRTLPYEAQLDFYFADYYEAKKLETEDFSVFLGVENNYLGAHFLIYGLAPEWYYAHPECLTMKKNNLLPMMQEAGALVIQAHPFREDSWIPHLSLFPRATHGVEIFNSSRPDEENAMALPYAEHYGLLHFAGSDNHRAASHARLGGMEGEERIRNESDFVRLVLEGKMHPFAIDNPLNT